MATLTKITSADLIDKGVIGLPDAPELTATAMQEKFDEIALDVIVPKFNNLIDELEGAFSTTDEAISDESDRAQEAEGELSDAIYALDEEVMKIAVYDTDADGVVDNAKQLDGHPVSDFLTSASLSDYYTKSQTDTALAGKVDKVNGKGLSTNDYTDADKTIVSGTTSALNGKVDKVEGKGLSKNDFTDAYRDQIGTNKADVQNALTRIGNLDDLVTTHKNNLVRAVNDAYNHGGVGDASINDLSDVTVSNPADGQVLKYNSASSKWENGSGGSGGASTLSDLTDTAIATPSTGQALVYNSVNKWTNVTLPFVDYMRKDEYASHIQKMTDTSLAVQLLYGNFDDLTFVGKESLSIYSDSPTSYTFSFAGNSYAVGDKLVAFVDSILNMNDKTVSFNGYSVSYTTSGGAETYYDVLSEVTIISETVPSDCDATKAFEISVSITGPLSGVYARKYKSSGSVNVSYPTTSYNTRFFIKSDGTLGYFNRTGDDFKVAGSGSEAINDLTDVQITSASNGDVLTYDSATSKWVNGVGAPANPIIPIDPTDPTYKSTPGAIWIETT